jgi:transposase InsO family protein
LQDTERQNDSGLRERLIALVREKPRFGYRRLHVLLSREGEQMNHKPVHGFIAKLALHCAARSASTVCGCAAEQAAGDLFGGEPGMGT